MSRVPTHHLRRSHRELVGELTGDARAAFARAGQPAWDPGRPTGDGEVDLGRGLLDSFAVALHVLWTYQQAWAEESFLATARLDASIDKLLGLVGYRPRPGIAATGLQHFRCRANAAGVISAGLQLVSPARGGEPEAIFETLEPIRIDPQLNELRAFLPPSGRAPARPPLRGGGDGEPKAPAPRSPFGKGSAFEALQDRLEVARHGPLSDRRLARAKAKARNLARLVNEYGLDQKAACKESIDSLCAQLCEAQQAVAEAEQAAPPDGSLSEAQEIIARQLRILARRHRDAVAALEGVLARCEDESDARYAHRLDLMAQFLDAFVGSLIQEARDQLVLLRGREAFSRLDRSLGGGTPVRGFARAAADGLYLPPIAAGDAQIDPTVRLGDWLIVGEDVPRTGPDGNPTTERIYREAIRVVRVVREVPRGETRPMVRIQFQPPLSRAYDLDRMVLLGNLGPVSHGRTVVERLTPALDLRTARLGQAPLTWLREPAAARGRAPQIGVAVAGRPWRRVDDLLAAGPDDAVFAVEPAPGGGARLRFGDGQSGARLPAGAAVVATYRIGVGATGHRSPGRITGLATHHPSVESTSNPLPTGGGADPEPRSGARDVGPVAAGALDRAISLADVVALARAYDGVALVCAICDPRWSR